MDALTLDLAKKYTDNLYKNLIAIGWGYTIVRTLPISNIDTKKIYLVPKKLPASGDPTDATSFNAYVRNIDKSIDNEKAWIELDSIDIGSVMKEYADNLSIKKKIVSKLPTENIKENTIYLVPKKNATDNDNYDEYIFIPNESNNGNNSGSSSGSSSSSGNSSGNGSPSGGTSGGTSGSGSSSGSGSESGGSSGGNPDTLRTIQVGDNLSGATIHVDFDAMGNFSVGEDLSIVIIECDNGSSLWIGELLQDESTFNRYYKSKNLHYHYNRTTTYLCKEGTGIQEFALPSVLGTVSKIKKGGTDDDSYLTDKMYQHIFISNESNNGNNGSSSGGSSSSGSESSGGSSSSDSESSGDSGSANNPNEITEGNFTYTVTDGKATIVKSTLAGNVTIPSELGGYTVTSIGDSLYHTCTPLRSIILPDSIISIGDHAFYGCTALTSITLPISATSIGSYAFAGCESLTSITIPNSVTSIGNGAFSDCTSLTSINVDESNSNYCSIDGALFNKNRTELIQYPIGTTVKTYVIPDSVTSIGNYAFNNCYSLKNVTIGKGVKTIGSYAFHNNPSLADVCYKSSEEDWNAISIGSNNTVFDTAAIYYNYSENLSYYTYTVTDGNATITKVDTSISGDIIIPSELGGYPVTSIGDRAFKGCTLLTSIKIPDSVTSIDDWVFIYCNSLTRFKVDKDNAAYRNYGDVLYNKTRTVLKRYPQGNTSIAYSIPEGVTNITDDAFSGCTSLQNVYIPKSVTYIGYSAFEGCNLSINGHTDSAAERYANEHDNITFIARD